MELWDNIREHPATRLPICGAIPKARQSSSARFQWRCSKLPSGRSIRHARSVKFAEFGKLDPTSAEARRFIELEEWANEGEPLPYPAAKSLIEELFGNDLSGSGAWRVGDLQVTDGLSAPALHFTAEHDHIAPAVTAPSGAQVGIPSGHVGMIVGSARHQLHDALRVFLERAR